jgi:hypothetical protein
LRKISTRAQITETSFVNSYDWGDFGGDPDRLMERYFDLFLYVPQWGMRQFSMRLPTRLLAASSLKRFTLGDGAARVRKTGENLVVDIVREELELDPEDDGRGWLDSLAPLRADALDGDFRIFYLVWLMAAEAGELPDDAVEPLPGIAPLTPSLEAFAEFFEMDGDFVEVAASAPAAGHTVEIERVAVVDSIHALDEKEKDALLLRLYDGDPHLRAELRRRGRQRAAARVEDRRPLRTVAELRAAAQRLADERHAAEAKRLQAEQRRQERKEAEAKKRRLEVLAARGLAAWADLESLINLRNGPAYEEAAFLLCDLRDLALQQDTDDEFHRRFRELRHRHERKPRFLERLAAASLD